MLSDAAEHFTIYILSLPDPLWIRLFALLGLLWLIYVTKTFFVQLVTLTFYIIGFFIWIINKIKKIN